MQRESGMGTVSRCKSERERECEGETNKKGKKGVRVKEWMARTVETEWDNGARRTRKADRRESTFLTNGALICAPQVTPPWRVRFTYVKNTVT